MSTNTATPPASGKLPFSRVLAAGGIAIVGSVIANLVVYFIGRMIVQPPADFLPLASPIPTILFTTLFLVVGTAVFAMVNAWSSNRARVFTIVAVIALVLGFIPDIMLISQPGVVTNGHAHVWRRDGPDRYALCGLCHHHVVVPHVGAAPLMA